MLKMVKMKGNYGEDEMMMMMIVVKTMEMEGKDRRLTDERKMKGNDG